MDGVYISQDKIRAKLNVSLFCRKKILAVKLNISMFCEKKKLVERKN